MSIPLTNLAWLAYTPNGATSYRANLDGGRSFLNLFLLQNLNEFIGDYDFFTLATEAQNSPKEDVKTTTNQKIKPNASSSSKTKKTPKTQATPTNDGASTPVNRLESAKRLEVEQMVDAFKQIKEPLKEGSPLHTPSSQSTAINDLTLSTLSPVQQQWFQQWLHGFIPPSHAGTRDSTRVEGRALGTSTASPSFQQEAESFSGKGKVPTPTERMEFLKFLQLQMEEAHKKGKPFRVEVDADTSVVLSVKQNEVSATFLMKETNDKQLEQVTQQLQRLQQSLQERKLPVGVLTATAHTKATPQKSRNKKKST